jgi:hypothetical protein
MQVAQHFVDFVPTFYRDSVTPWLTDPTLAIGEFECKGFTLEGAITHDPFIVQNDRNIRRGGDQERRRIGIDPGKPARR